MNKESLQYSLADSHKQLNILIAWRDAADFPESEFQYQSMVLTNIQGLTKYIAKVEHQLKELT